MQVELIDWIIIVLFFGITLLIGLLSSKKSGKSSTEFFLSGRNMPWWLLGISMVATTFSADTPNLVTDIVRKNGVAGNWLWWAFLLTGMLTVFIYAKLWRRSGIVTDIEFYELRYSGNKASFLRGFRAIYLGVFFNILIMAGVMLAGIKIGGVLLGLTGIQTILLVSIITVFYSAMGGLRGVIFTDLFQFILSMMGMVMAAVYIVNLPEIGGLNSLVSNPVLDGKLNFFPDFNNTNLLIPLFIIPIAVQWWSVWYPGAEPGGGGYVAQRMLSAKDEKNAVMATMLFNFAHYALRPWPWILIALASIIVFPDLASIQSQFPDLGAQVVIDDDLAFSAMLSYLPKGLLGLVVASLIAALMSTISSHLNWGSSYIVHDVIKRFIDPRASEKKLVLIGRLSTVGLMIAAAVFALFLSNALQAFNILLSIGAGTGLLFILRWFWWRINAYSEITAMTISFIVALIFEFSTLGENLVDYEKMLINILVTTVAWVTVTLLTPPTDRSVLERFYKKIRPHKMGWKPVVESGMSNGVISKMDLPKGRFTTELLMMILGCVMVYSALFLIGNLLYQNSINTIICMLTSIFSGLVLWKLWRSQEDV